MKIKAFKIIDTQEFLDNPNSKKAEKTAKVLAKHLEDFGFVIVKDSRVSEEIRQKFFKMMAAFVELPEYKLWEYDWWCYNRRIGYTPRFCEAAVNRADIINAIPAGNKPYKVPKINPYFRWMQPHGKRPNADETDYPDLNFLFEPELKQFPQWKNLFLAWGDILRQVGETVLSMAAKGWDINENSFTKLCEQGPSVLSVSGSLLNPKLKSLGKKAVFSGFHNDSSFITIHGTASEPGLRIWDRALNRYDVNVPEGCSLIQVGREFEQITGGKAHRGYHEVIYKKELAIEIEEASAKKKFLWRLSSPYFMHLNSDTEMRPVKGLDEKERLLSVIKQHISDFKLEESVLKKPKDFVWPKAGDRMTLSLKAIKLIYDS